jgi:preprotein translocase subunit SecE
LQSLGFDKRISTSQSTIKDLHVPQDSKKAAFFSIHKPGQGKWVRWGTVAALTLVAGLGAQWLVQKELSMINNDMVGVLIKVGAAIVWLGLWGLFAFWFVASPRWGEFMIMTESEMRKVAWPSRREVVSSTKVVIILTLALGVLLWIVDIGFIQLFKWVGIT